MGEALMKIYETMPETAQRELYDFALFLVSREGKAAQEEKSHFCAPNRKAGIAKDPDFYMSLDFDEPLEDFAEYMR